jgi:flavin reductase (DIM6/NTAB) family NADH-FMN oxidoreductase RutF
LLFQKIKMNHLFEPADPFQIKDNVFKLLHKDWMLLTAGVENDFNCMTASWGGLGMLWNMPVAYVFIRPVRFTYEFSEKHDELTITFFGEKYRDALNLCGKLSGRDNDKVKLAGLTPLVMASGSIAFDEARMIMDCRKLYHTDIIPEHFRRSEIDRHYPMKDYHRMYIYQISDCFIKK